VLHPKAEECAGIKIYISRVITQHKLFEVKSRVFFLSDKTTIKTEVRDSCANNPLKRFRHGTARFMCSDMTQRQKRGAFATCRKNFPKLYTLHQISQMACIFNASNFLPIIISIAEVHNPCAEWV